MTYPRLCNIAARGLSPAERARVSLTLARGMPYSSEARKEGAETLQEAIDLLTAAKENLESTADEQSR